MHKNQKARHTVPIEARINAAQEKVVRQKTRYDSAVAKLDELLKQRERLCQKELKAAIDKRDHTFEEIMQSSRANSVTGARQALARQTDF